MSILAITGATGFVGGHLVDLALAGKHEVRALTRRAQPPREGVIWVDGALDRPDSLAALVAGSDAVIHVAGTVNAPDRADFAAGNIDGTRAMIAASAGRRFVHVSSLSAREPELSAYGWSKAEAERLVEASTLDWTIVRPPAVYGPGDTDMRDLFRMAAHGIVLLPPRGRASLIAVDDLAALLLALAAGNGLRQVLEVDDGVAVSHAELARAIGTAVGRRVLPLHVPRPLLSLAARADRWARGADAKLTADRVGYLCHPNWVVDPARRPAPDLWRPLIPLAAGLAATAQWYRDHEVL